MTTHPHKREDAPYWSLPGLAEGAWRAAPLLPGTIIFGTAFGTIAAQKGLTLGDAVLMNALVCAGAAQLVGLEVWTDRSRSGRSYRSRALTLIVNARLILMGASLRPWLGPLPAWQVYPMLLLTTDATWIVGMRYRAEGGNDASVYLGGGWRSGPPGSPRRSRLSARRASSAIRSALALTSCCRSSLPRCWCRSGVARSGRIGWVIAGVVALVAAQFIAGWWFIVVGAVRRQHRRRVHR